MRRLRLSTLLLVSLAALAAARAAQAGSTNPTLAIGAFSARPAGPGAVAEITGILAFDDVMQIPFPLNVVVYTGTTFVRYPIGGVARSGVFADLADGLQPGEIGALEAAGAIEPAAEVLRIEPNRVIVSLPAALSAGTLHAVAYVELAGEGSFVSNDLPALVDGGQP